MLTFVNGELVEGNYDIYDESAFTAGDGEAIDSSTNNDRGVFQDVLEDTHQRTIPTLIGVAQKIAQKEGKKLDEKQYIAYEVIACSFLLCFIEDAEFNCTSGLHNVDDSQKDILI